MSANETMVVLTGCAYEYTEGKGYWRGGAFG